MLNKLLILATTTVFAIGCTGADPGGGVADTSGPDGVESGYSTKDSGFASGKPQGVGDSGQYPIYDEPRPDDGQQPGGPQPPSGGPADDVCVQECVAGGLDQVTCDSLCSLIPEGAETLPEDTGTEAEPAEF